jgi:hypothetical protein
MRKHYIKEQDAYITLGTCPPNHLTTLDPNCDVPTKTARIEASPTKSFALGYTLFTGTGTRPPPGAALPTHTTWDGELEWEDSEEGDDDKDDGDDKSTCKLWFFNVSQGRQNCVKTVNSLLRCALDLLETGRVALEVPFWHLPRRCGY